MKGSLKFFIFFIAVLYSLGGHASTIRFLTYNIRYFNWGDGSNAWPYRKDKLIQQVKSYDPLFIGMQEVLKSQLEDLEQGLGTQYQWIGVGRDDGKEGGEFNPIFYRPDLFTLLETGTFWLAPDPLVPSGVAWDAACPRIVTYGHFIHKETGEELIYFNTHFDHRGYNAQLMSVDVVNNQLLSLHLSEDIPFVMTGDFNLNEKSEAYQKLTQFFQDARYLSKSGHKGPTASYVGDKDWTTLSAAESRIDYIFVKKVRAVHQHQIIDEKYNGRYLSDHLPLLSDIEI